MKIHMVKKGDTLYELSKKYGVSLEKIIEVNPQLSNPDQLSVGDKIKIPSQATPVPVPEHIIHKHAVKQGDSLWKLSKAWGISLQAMIEANPQLKNPNALLLGEIVNIPKSGGSEQPQQHNPVMDKTVPGSKTYTGPKENVTAPKESVTAPKEIVTAPKEIVTAPKPTQPVIPQLPQLPEMPVQHQEKVSTTPLPNPPPAPTPVAPAPIQAPVFEKSVAPVQPLPTNEGLEVEHFEMKQHLYIQFPVPAQEVMYEKQAEVEVNPISCSDTIPQGMEKTSYYPGLTDNSSFTQPTQFNCPPFYEQSNLGGQNWANAQVEQPCYAEVYPMSYAIPESYISSNMPTHLSQSVGGENSQFVNFAPTPMLMANQMASVPVNYAPYYSCTPPYEWTYPQPEAQGGYQTVPAAPYGAYGSGYSMPESAPPKDCGCRQPDELLQAEVSEFDSTEEAIENSGELLVSREEVQGEEATEGYQAIIKSAPKSNVAPRKKQAKSKSSRQRRHNPWING